MRGGLTPGLRRAVRQCQLFSPSCHLSSTKSLQNICCETVSQLPISTLVFVSCRGFACSVVTQYNEDYEKLGVSTTATKEEIKAAYFARAKQLHPDSAEGELTEKDKADFYELNEAYRRLVYESKHGTSEFDPEDPRNDPRCVEYWQIRKRTVSEETRKAENDRIQQEKSKEKVIIRRATTWLLVGVFMGTIFPAMFVGQDDYSDDPYSTSGCQCRGCTLSRMERSPGAQRMMVKSVGSRECTASRS